MNWLLDTTVLSQLAKQTGNRKVIAWMKREKARCCTSSIVIAQLACWVRTKKGGSRQLLEKWLSHLVTALDGRIYNFNVSVAHTWADQKWLFEKESHPMPMEDSFITATARKYNLTIATGNEKDFHRSGLEVFNPFNII